MSLCARRLFNNALEILCNLFYGKFSFVRTVARRLVDDPTVKADLGNERRLVKMRIFINFYPILRSFTNETVFLGVLC